MRELKNIKKRNGFNIIFKKIPKLVKVIKEVQRNAIEITPVPNSLKNDKIFNLFIESIKKGE